ncbi:MAG: hypothetical protein J5651_02905 [Salinivirgaceae bacterium]|nr:hypothetical protein [Salinivirgaceae bacterium]
MKTLRLILAVALAATISACEDEHFDKDRCRISSFSDYSNITVEQEGGIYQLYWETPKATTNRNTDVVFTDKCEYEVCVVIVEGADDWQYENEPQMKSFPITKTTGTWANISSDEVIKFLGNAQDFYFAVRLPNVHARLSYLDWKSDIFDGIFSFSDLIKVEAQPNSQKDNYFNVYSSNESIGTVSESGYYEYGEDVVLKATAKNDYSFYCWSDGYLNPEYKTVIYDDLWAVFRKQDYKLESNFQGLNTWFLAGDNKPSGKVENGNYIINIVGEVERDDNGNATVWNDNFEIVFNGLPLQSIGNEFKIEFDIMWVGDKEGAVFRICSGADNYIEEISKMDETFVPLSQENEEVWNPEYNTELIFADFNEEMGKTFTVGNEVEHIQWGGTIGKRGEKYIGIEINLAGKEENSIITSNGQGTFIISNMQILINGKPVW